MSEVGSGYYLLNTDGGEASDGMRNKNDPRGEAAIAVVLKDSNDRLVEGFAAGIGRNTKDLAEYRALIEGLTFALAEGISKIRVYMDAEYIVDLMNNGAEPKSAKLKDFHAQARVLFEKFPDRRISWVPRERNQEADSLVRSILYPDKQSRT